MAVLNNMGIMLQVIKVNKGANNKHKIWMTNSGYLYDRLFVQKLKWPTLTFQWMPTINEGKYSSQYEFLYASHSSGQQSIQHIYLAEITFPHLQDIDSFQHQSEVNDLLFRFYSSSIQPVNATMTNKFKFNHQQQVNRVRYFQSDPSFIAARTDQGSIAIYKIGNNYPVQIMKGITSSGFALDWKVYGLLSGDHEGNICLWKDINQKAYLYYYDDKIEDTKWLNSMQFLTASDNGSMIFWDVRNPNPSCIVQTCMSEMKEVYCLAINEKNDNLILSGGQDSLVKLWDRRNLAKKLHYFQGHEKSIMSIQWSRVNKSIFGSGSIDCTCKIWDLMRVGFQVPKDLGGTDQLLFTHEGHRGGVNELSWNHYEMILGSSQQQFNTIQMYQISNNIEDLEYHQDMEYLMENCFA